MVLAKPSLNFRSWLAYPVIKTLLVILLLQFVTIFTKDGVEYQSEFIKDTKIVRTKSVMLTGDYANWYSMNYWNIDCQNKMASHQKMEVYNSIDKVVLTREGEKKYFKVEKNSFGDVSFFIWCR